MNAATQSNISIKSTGYQSESKELDVLIYEKSDIPKYLIDRCEELSIENNETYFIFDRSISNLIKSRYTLNKQEKREILLDELVSDDDKFHIGTELYFREMPSRFSYYDTETKETNKYRKYKIVTDFLEKIGFSPNREFNFGLDYDQSYILMFDEPQRSYIIRIKPNLFLSIQSGFTHTGTPNNIFDGFFSRQKILDSISKDSPSIFLSIIRDIKIESIL